VRWRPAPIDAAAEAARLSRRFEGREFEIPAYRYSTLFDAAASGT
jgi:hypothetical protein